MKAVDLRAGAVQSRHVRDGTLQAADFAPGELPAGGAGGAAEAAGIPAGAVGFFQLASCPSGWTEFAPARGRYVVGVPEGGALGGTAGTGLANLENRAVGTHTHGITDPGHDHFARLDAGVIDASSVGPNFDSTSSVQSEVGHRTDEATTGISVNAAGSVAGTNAPYVQLRACLKG